MARQGDHNALTVNGMDLRKHATFEQRYFSHVPVVTPVIRNRLLGEALVGPFPGSDQSGQSFAL